MCIHSSPCVPCFPAIGPGSGRPVCQILRRILGTESCPLYLQSTKAKSYGFTAWHGHTTGAYCTFTLSCRTIPGTLCAHCSLRNPSQRRLFQHRRIDSAAQLLVSITFCGSRVCVAHILRNGTGHSTWLGYASSHHFSAHSQQRRYAFRDHDRPPEFCLEYPY